MFLFFFISSQSEYIKNMGLGGGMIWALDLDDFRNKCGCEPHPLLRTINRVLRTHPDPDPKCAKLGGGEFSNCFLGGFLCVHNQGHNYLWWCPVQGIPYAPTTNPLGFIELCFKNAKISILAPILLHVSALYVEAMLTHALIWLYSHHRNTTPNKHRHTHNISLNFQAAVSLITSVVEGQ